MAPRSSGPDDREPFKALCEDLSKAMKKEGIIKLPKKTVDRMSQFAQANKENDSVFSDVVIVDLVSILEGDSSDDQQLVSTGSVRAQILQSHEDIPLNIKSCARLDASTWTVVLQILLLAQRCHSAERGVYLLAASLHYRIVASEPPGSTKALNTHKAVIGHQVFRQLLECFITRHEENHMRVWVGLILILLLKNCEENGSQMMLAPEETRRRLGSLVIDEDDEIVRIIGGKMLKASLKAGFGTENFCDDKSSALLTNFPLSQPNSIWNQDFQVWADENATVFGTYEGAFHFGHVIRTKPAIFEASGKDIDISIFISRDENEYEMSIYVQALGLFFDRRLDIPLSLISDIRVEETLLDFPHKASMKPFDLVISLLEPSDEEACYINAAPSMVDPIRKIRITMGDEEVAGLLVNDLKERNGQIEVCNGSHPLQESGQGSWNRVSQSSFAVYLADDSTKDSAAKTLPKYADFRRRSRSVGDRIAENEKPKEGNSMEPSSPAAPAENMVRIPDVKRHSHQGSPNLSNPAPAAAKVPIVANNAAYGERSQEKSHSINSHGQKQPLNASKDKETAKLDSNTQKKGRSKNGREISAQQIASQKAVTVSPQGTGSQPKRGRPRKRSVKEAESSSDDGTAEEAVAKFESTLNRISHQAAQGANQDHSSNRRVNVVQEQPRIQVAEKGKGKRKLIDNSGTSTDKSKSRTLQSPDLKPVHESISNFSTPDFHDASTSKTVRNALQRQKNEEEAVAVKKAEEEAAAAKSKKLSKDVESKSVESKPSAPVKKKYGLHPLKAKPPVKVAKPSVKLSDKEKQNSAQDRVDVDANFSDQSDDEGASAKARAKATQKFSNRTINQMEKESAPGEKERDEDIWEMPFDAEDVPKVQRGKGKASAKISKPDSKNSATSSKATTKKTNVKSIKPPAAAKNVTAKKKRSAPAVVNEVPARPRSKRQAAVAAASKISQQSSDNEILEDIEPAHEEGVDEKTVPTVKPTISIASKKSAEGLNHTSTKGAVEKANTLPRKPGNRTGKPVAKSKQSVKEVPIAPQEDMGEPSESVFQQLQEDALKLGLSQEQDGVVEHNSNVASPARIREKSPKRRHKSMAAALRDVIEGIETNGNEDHARSSLNEDHAQEKDVVSKIGKIPNDILPEVNHNQRERTPASTPTLSSAVKAKLHSALRPAHKVDQYAQRAPQPGTMDPMSAPRIERKRDVFGIDSSPFGRHLSDLQHADLPAELNGPHSPKMKTRKVISKVVKKSTPPRRRSPRLHDQATGAGVVAHEEIGQDTLVVDDRLARKTPLIAFGKTGPRNQGVSSSKKISAQSPALLRSVEAAESQKLHNAETRTEMQPRRKRGAEVVDQDRGPRKRVRSSQEIQEKKEEEDGASINLRPKSRSIANKTDLNEAEIVDDEEGNNYYIPRIPRAPLVQKAAAPETAEESDVELYEPHQQKIGGDSPLPVIQENSQSQKGASQTSRVDENGSPVASKEATAGYQKFIRGLINKVTKKDKEILQGAHSGYKGPDGTVAGGFFSPNKAAESAGHFEMSSNAKAKPMAPEIEQEKYVAHRETGDDRYEDITSKEVIHSKHQIEDPFAEKHPRRKLSGFTERLEATRTKRVEKPHPALTTKLMQPSQSENDKHQQLQDTERIKGTARNGGIPVETVQSLPQPKKPTSYLGIIKAPVETVQSHILDDRPKRKTSVELEQDQPDGAGQRKRRKILFEVEEPNLGTEKQEQHRRLQQQAPKLAQPIHGSVQDEVNARPRSNSPSRIENAKPDTGIMQPKKPFVTTQNQRTQKRALKQAESPAVAVEKSYQRRVQERPVNHRPRRSRREFEDPEKTLVEEQSSLPSELTSGSSGSTQRTESSPVSPQFSPEEEWDVQLRRHERSIVESLYRIVNELVGHLVGQREAIEDVVDDYINGGTELIEVLEREHSAEKDRVLADFEAAKAELSKAYFAAQRTIARGSKEAQGSAILGLERQWREQDAELQSFISESMDEE